MDLNVKDASQCINSQDPSGTSVGQKGHGCDVLVFGGDFSHKTAVIGCVCAAVLQK
jgi:hypothetical protein